MKHHPRLNQRQRKKVLTVCRLKCLLLPLLLSSLGSCESAVDDSTPDGTPSPEDARTAPILQDKTPLNLEFPTESAALETYLNEIGADQSAAESAANGHYTSDKTKVKKPGNVSVKPIISEDEEVELTDRLKGAEIKIKKSVE